MTRDQKAIIQRAKREGLFPMQLAEELLAHDLLELMLTQMKAHAVAFKNMSEIQQDSAIATMQDGLKKAVQIAVGIIGTGGSKTVRMNLKGVAAGKKLKLTGEISADEEYKHELIDAATDQADVLVLLNERDFLQGLDAIQGEKQQKSLPIDSEEGAQAKPPASPKNDKAKGGSSGKNVADIASAVAFKPEDLEKAKAFCEEFRIPTIQGIQNALSCGFNKGEAIIQELARQGVIVHEEGDRYRMPPLSADAVVVADAGTDGPGNLLAEEPDDNKGNTGGLTDELYDQMRDKVVIDQKVSAGMLAVAFDVDVDLAEKAIDRMEMDGYVSDEDDMGGRSVLIASGG